MSPKEEKKFFTVEIYRERRDRMVVEAQNKDEAVKRAFSLGTSDETSLNEDWDVCDVCEGFLGDKPEMRQHEAGWQYAPYA